MKIDAMVKKYVDNPLENEYGKRLPIRGQAENDAYSLVMAPVYEAVRDRMRDTLRECMGPVIREEDI
jgi:hypothetical protein